MNRQVIYVYFVFSDTVHSVESDIETKSRVTTSIAENNSVVVTHIFTLFAVKTYFLFFHVQYDSFFWNELHLNWQLSSDVDTVNLASYVSSPTETLV